jgi:hypothetical protein
LNITATPKHRVARKIGDDKDDKRYKLQELKDIPSYSYILRKGNYNGGEEIREFKVPDYETRKCKLDQPKIVNGDDYVEFMGWFLSEGSTLDRDKMFAISQTKQPQTDEIKDLLERMGFEFNYNTDSFIVYSPEWWNYLRKFGKCQDKFVPKNIMESTPRQLEIFLDAAVKGDGHKKGNSIYYYSLSKKLIDQISEIGIKLGYVITFSDRLRKNRTKRSYQVRLKYRNKVGDGEVLKKKAEYIDYEGYVYDIGVENTHNFFIRQKNTVWVSGNSWVKNRFIDPMPPEEIYKPEMGGTRQFIPAKVYDNPHINQEDYIENLDALDKDLRDALLNGNWDSFGGKVFKEFEREHHVIEPFEIPVDWVKYMAVDWGYRDPFCVHWGAVAQRDLQIKDTYIPKNAVVIYREYYGCKENEPNTGVEREADLVAQDINSMENEQVHIRIGGHDMFARRGSSGPSIAEEFSNNYIYLQRADISRMQGKNEIHQRLRIREKDGQKYSYLYFFNNCRGIIRTLPTLPYSNRDVEDVDTDAEDHPYDSLRYLVMGRPMAKKTRKKTKKKKKTNWGKYTGY